MECYDDLTPQALAQKWCFICARRRFGQSRDNPYDIAIEFEAWIEVGIEPKKIADEIERKGRDRSEHLWMMKERLRPARQSNRPTEKDLRDKVEAALRKSNG